MQEVLTIVALSCMFNKDTGVAYRIDFAAQIIPPREHATRLQVRIGTVADVGPEIRRPADASPEMFPYSSSV
ncbi:hypothetical protein [Sinorhizobium meliloti]|uniref:hypothetical protein n=1 Tax=Rhizobium meliloti TaxID=382 RepID=UPI000FDA1333|nr:hypothetical protein [Sinorhizobium meliloti]RVN34501.1 hypothetical protein CN118_22430 [Sinorhizobium meliloti]